MNNKEMLYIKQNGECYIDKDCKWKNIDECKYWKNRCKEIGDQARKETASEFAKKVKSKIKELKKIYHEDCINGTGDEEYNGITESDIDELLKEIE